MAFGKEIFGDETLAQKLVALTNSAFFSAGLTVFRVIGSVQIGTTSCQGQLSDAEIQLVEMSIEMAGDSPPREWLRSLHSWLASHGKPRWTAEPVENLQAQRLRRAQVYLKAGGRSLDIVNHL